MNLSENQIIKDFHLRRDIFDRFLKERDTHIGTCPGCGYPTLKIRANFEICPLCNWEDDGQDDSDAEIVFGGPNGMLSLTQQRLSFGRKLQKHIQDAHSEINLDPKEVIGIISNQGLGVDIPISALIKASRESS